MYVDEPPWSMLNVNFHKLEAHCDLTTFVRHNRDVFSLVRRLTRHSPREAQREERSFITRTSYPTKGSYHPPTADLRLENDEISSSVDVECLGRKFYKHYLIVRSSPSLRVLFSDCFKGQTIQMPLMSLISCSQSVRARLLAALENSRKVTARIDWTPEDGKPYWLHCTPLSAVHGSSLIWVIILLETSSDTIEDEDRAPQSTRNVNTNITPWDDEQFIVGASQPQHSAPGGRGSLLSSLSSNESPDIHPTRSIGKPWLISKRPFENSTGTSVMVGGVPSDSASSQIPGSEGSHKAAPTASSIQGVRLDGSKDQAPRKSYKSLSPYGVLI